MNPELPEDFDPVAFREYIGDLCARTVDESGEGIESFSLVEATIAHHAMEFVLLNHGAPSGLTEPWLNVMARVAERIEELQHA